MPELTPNDIEFMQIIEEVGTDTMRVYKIVKGHMGDDIDPLTTIHVSGYKDVQLNPPLKEIKQQLKEG